jgi:hypothetical protein
MPSWAINSKKLSNYIKLSKMVETLNNAETAQLGIGAVSSSLLSREGRIKIVNEIIKDIALRGREFFLSKKDADMAYIFQVNGRLYMHNEYNKKDMCLSTKNGYPPKHWHHGGTLWGLTKDFKDFISTGEKSNHKHGYGGLLCPHWGYPETDMKAIQEKAVSLGYL